MGVSLENIEIAAPFWEPPEEEEEVVIEEPEEEIEPSHEPEADTGEENEELPQLEDAEKEVSAPVKSCHTVPVEGSKQTLYFLFFAVALSFFRRKAS